MSVIQIGDRMAQALDRPLSNHTQRWLVAGQFTAGIMGVFVPNQRVGIFIVLLGALGSLAVAEVNGRGWGQQGWTGVAKFGGAFSAYATGTVITTFLAWNAMH